MSRSRKNLAASVTTRLLNLARQRGDDFQVLLTAYCFERFLYRLGRSALRPRFILKGAMLLQLWSDRPYRTTRDLDLLRRGEGALEEIRADLEMICATPVEPDAVEFDAGAIRVEIMRGDDDTAGTHATLPTRCGTARLRLRIDIGTGDAVWPPPRRVAYPRLLDLPAPAVLAYPQEAVVAEKVHAMVVLGDRNSRIKDFFDLHFLAGQFEFERSRLTEAVRRTFARRETPIPEERPFGLSQAYWRSPSRPAQVRAFARRAGLSVPEPPDSSFVDLLGAFLLPLLADARSGRMRRGIWTPGGPWEEIE